MAVVGPLTLSYRGTLVQPQDVSTILLSLAAGAIAAQPAISVPKPLSSTVVALIGVTSIATGLTAYAMGVMKLGYLVRFVPFPGCERLSGRIRGSACAGGLRNGGARRRRRTMPNCCPLWPLWLPWAGGVAGHRRRLAAVQQRSCHPPAPFAGAGRVLCCITGVDGAGFCRDARDWPAAWPVSWVDHSFDGVDISICFRMCNGLPFWPRPR